MTVDTAKLRRLLDEGTPRPWFRQDGILSGPDKGNFNIGHGIGDTYASPTPSADAALITEAVNALPVLLDERDALVAALKQARDDLTVNPDIAVAAALDHHTPWAQAMFDKSALWMSCSCGWNAGRASSGTWNEHFTTALAERLEAETGS
jgi:hypothetical protein